MKMVEYSLIKEKRKKLETISRTTVTRYEEELVIKETSRWDILKKEIEAVIEQLKQGKGTELDQVNTTIFNSIYRKVSLA